MDIKKIKCYSLQSEALTDDSEITHRAEGTWNGVSKFFMGLIKPYYYE